MRHLALLLVLTGCAGFQFPEQPGPHPATLWADANARYSGEQHEAALFAKRCDRDPSLFLSNCYATVRSMSQVDKMAETVQDKGHGALGRRDHKTLFEAIEELDDLGRQLENILQKGDS